MCFSAKIVKSEDLIGQPYFYGCRTFVISELSKKKGKLSNYSNANLFVFRIVMMRIFYGSKYLKGYQGNVCPRKYKSKKQVRPRDKSPSSHAR